MANRGGFAKFGTGDFVKAGEDFYKVLGVYAFSTTGDSPTYSYEVSDSRNNKFLKEEHYLTHVSDMEAETLTLLYG